MHNASFKLLKTVAKTGEISMDAAIRLSQGRRSTHIDQYPLALLLEGGYLGCTVSHQPPSGAEQMREFSLATTLHIFSLPKNATGEVEYLGIRSRGAIDAKNERIFLKAKGALYLNEHRQKVRDRVWSFVLGFVAGVLVPLTLTWIKQYLGLRA